jgi:hypothetical protein
MTQLPNNPQTVVVKPRPNVYTMLLVVTILALIAAIVLMAMKLMSAPPAGYGLEFGDLLTPASEPKP